MRIISPINKIINKICSSIFDLTTKLGLGLVGSRWGSSAVTKMFLDTDDKKQKESRRRLLQ